jgi:hypothetical protein
MDAQILLIGALLLFVFAGVIWNSNQQQSERQRLLALEAERIESIENKRETWGDEITDLLIRKKVRIGMSDEMVAASWGAPADIDQKEITAKGIKERWVYGVRRKSASYVSFKDGIVTAIKQTGIK